MKSFRWLLGTLLIVLLIAPGYAIMVRKGDEIEIKEDEVIDDDLVAFGQNVTINGEVYGDVYAFAQEVNIKGSVYGSIFSGGATVTVDAERANTIWAAGGNVKVLGAANKNVILFGGKLNVGEDASIGKDLRIYGGQCTVNGSINGTLKGGVGSFVMGGKSGDIKIKADEIKIKSSARISGDLTVKGKDAPIVEEGAIITGETKIQKPSEKKEAFFLTFAPVIACFITFLRIVCFVAKIIVGLILIALFKSFVRRIMDTLIIKPWKSLGWGFLVLIVIPVAVVILFIVMIGFPFAVFGIYLYSILFYLSSIFISLVVGEKVIQLFKKKGEISLYLSLIVGIVVVYVLGLIPILGIIIKIFVLLFGAGALLLGCWNLMREMREKKLL
jgi:cytoskeletal protein CcmA (bactofilin family)